MAVSRPGAERQEADPVRQRGRHVRFWDWTAKQPEVAQLDHHAGVLAVACTGPEGGPQPGPVRRPRRRRPADRPRPLAAGRPRPRRGASSQAPPIKLSERHKGPITCVAFSPDGAFCATGGEDRAIRLWRRQDGKLLYTLTPPTRPPSLRCSSPSSRTSRCNWCPPAATTRWRLEPRKTSTTPTPTAASALPQRRRGQARRQRRRQARPVRPRLGAARAVAGRPPDRGRDPESGGRDELHDDGPVLAGRQHRSDQLRLGRPACSCGGRRPAAATARPRRGTASVRLERRHGHVRRLRPDDSRPSPSPARATTTCWSGRCRRPTRSGQAARDRADAGGTLAGQRRPPGARLGRGQQRRLGKGRPA